MSAYRDRLLRERGIETTPVTYSDPNSFADIENRFSFHPATTDETKGKHEAVRELCKAVAHNFDDALPPGREKSLALTKLEEAMMWANAGIARHRDTN